MYTEITKQAFIKAVFNIPYKITSLEFITLYEHDNGYIKTIGNITGITNYFRTNKDAPKWIIQCYSNKLIKWLS